LVYSIVRDVASKRLYKSIEDIFLMFVTKCCHSHNKSWIVYN